jgi:hypothetical protein
MSHGHNEDWSDEVKPLWYWLKQKVKGQPGCAGLTYPGMLLGYAVTWTERGLFTTQNSLFPNAYNDSGLPVTLVQKDAICSASSLDDAIDRLRVPGWSTAASLNLVDWLHGGMANLEVFLNRHAVHRVVAGGNYSHENMFKQGPFVDRADLGPDPSTLHRQARLDSLPPPQHAADIITLLGDTHDIAFPIYRNITLTSVVIDAKRPGEATLSIWEDDNPNESPAKRTWDMGSFFHGGRM